MAIRRKSNLIDSADKAIDELGGTFAVADFFGEDPRVISNWRKRGLPPDTYLVMGPALTALGFTFDPVDLFNQRAIPTNRVPKRPAKSQPPRSTHV